MCDGLVQVVVAYGLLAIRPRSLGRTRVRKLPTLGFCGAAALSEGKAKLLPQAPGVGHKPGDRSP